MLLAAHMLHVLLVPRQIHTKALLCFLQESCGVSLAQYQVYSHLMRAGYIVTR